MNIAAVLAGGSGSRMGAEIPKQFLSVNGRPIIIRSISAFAANAQIDMCIVSVQGDYIDKTQELIDRYIKTDKKIYVIAGGNTRGETLFSVLEFMKAEKLLDGSVLLTHDAVRPFINDRIVKDSLAAARQFGASGVCIPSVDTVFFSSDGNFIDKIPDRRTVFSAQTPQCFRAGLLYELILKTPPDVFSSFSDGCSIFVYHGKKVALVRGEAYNIKITYPDDIERAEMIAEKYFD